MTFLYNFVNDTIKKLTWDKNWFIYEIFSSYNLAVYNLENSFYF